MPILRFFIIENQIKIKGTQTICYLYNSTYTAVVSSIKTRMLALKNDFVFYCDSRLIRLQLGMPIIRSDLHCCRITQENEQ